MLLVPPAARLPHSPKSLMGLANLRGTVIPLIDSHAMLGLGAFTSGTTSRAIVLNGPVRTALAVDAVEQLLTLDARGVETARPDLTAEAGEILLGAFQAGPDHPITRILDLPALLGVAFSEHRQTDRQTDRHTRPPMAPVARKHEAGGAAPVEQRLLLAFEVANQDYALP